MDPIRLYDPSSGGSVGVPRRRLLRVEVIEPGLRALVTADLLRRVAGRGGRQVLTAYSGELHVGDIDVADYNLPVFERAEGADADVRIGREARTPPCLVVPPETGDWYSVMADGGFDPLYARLAMLEARYRDPLHLSGSVFLTASQRLDTWRHLVAGWAEAPGRPMDKAYVAEALAALADDLDSPTALAVLDRLADDPDVAPGAKLDTFIHLDLLLALDMVRDIGR